ncbi:MAG TPA: hypothetical protein VG206_11235 [Terriglobia bacterium]|nr:hypothetical protein [Terriglobia bacterium]
MTNIFINRKSYLRGAGLAVALLCWAGAGSGLALAQKPAADTIRASQVEQATPAEIDAERGALDRFLDAHPEIQNDVLSEPQRVNDPNYIHDHPELQAFLEAHPQVKADPRSFISPANWRLLNRRSDTDELLGWFVPFSVFVVCLLAVLWVLRYVLENRRWNKTFKVHEEVHAKLIEKFASGQELTAYMQSEAGRRLLEWTPPSFDMPSRGVPAAAGRIVWSIQAGLILGLVGFGLLFIRDRMPDAVEPLLVFGTLGLTIGAGFILSALISYGLSKQLGLLNGARHVGAPLAGR